MKEVVVEIISRINPEGDKEYLLISSQKDFGEYTGYFYPPGGHLEEGESPEEALVRELKEELGVESEPVREIAKTPGDVKDQTTHWWECEIKGELNPDYSQIKEVGFFTKDQMKDINLWPATKNFFAQY